MNTVSSNKSDAGDKEQAVQGCYETKRFDVLLGGQRVKPIGSKALWVTVRVLTFRTEGLSLIERHNCRRRLQNGQAGRDENERR